MYFFLEATFVFGRFLVFIQWYHGNFIEINNGSFAPFLVKTHQKTTQPRYFCQVFAPFLRLDRFFSFYAPCMKKGEFWFGTPRGWGKEAGRVDGWMLHEVHGVLFLVHSLGSGFGKKQYLEHSGWRIFWCNNSKTTNNPNQHQSPKNHRFQFMLHFFPAHILGKIWISIFCLAEV